MNSLTENFKFIDRLQGRIQKLQKQKEQFIKDNKDNEILKEFIKILEKEKQLNSNLKEYKDILYDNMCDENIDVLSGNHLDITLKRPYYKTEVLTKKFLKDNKEGSKLYEKYVTKKQVKGNLIIKEL